MSTNTPPSTASSTAGQSPPDPQFRVVRKRNRVPLSCGPCRHRKLKCNRGHPCDNCIKRGDTPSCAYATPGSRKKSASSTGSNASPDEMQNRIDRLEGLVLALVTNGHQSAGPAAAHAALTASSAGSVEQPGPYELVADAQCPMAIQEASEGADESEVENVTKSIGVMKMDKDKTFFASEAHWYAILGEISEVKNYFSDHKKQFDEQLRRYQSSHGSEGPKPGTAFLFGAPKPASHAEILSRFPPKATTDFLCARYFNTYDPAIHVIHGPTFQEQYNRHWENPAETPVIWLGLVFAMMCIALQSYSRAGDEPPEYKGKSWDMSSEYRLLTAQCLVMADITQPVTHMLETLVLHVYADYARSRDAEAGVLISTGIIVRLAMRMGLHRDSRPYPNISVFQGEMRRRLWAAIRSMDLLFSAQAGLPPICRPRDTNTEIPRNIYDDEISENSIDLKPSRPESESTPMLFLINRSRLIYKLGDAVELTESLTCAQYDDVLRVDAEARKRHDDIAPSLKIRPMDESARDPSSLIMQRFTLDLLFLKIICTLHRKFLCASRFNQRFVYSRRACIEACMTMLQHQATLHRECQPGGRLRHAKWFISSLTTVDFLLAAMIVSSDLWHSAQAERQGRLSTGDSILWTNERRDEMLEAIETAVGIWGTLKDESMEAYKAHTTLSVMLEQLKPHQKQYQGMRPAAPGGFSTASGSSFQVNTAMDDANVAPEHSAAMTLGMLSTGGMTSSSANMFDTRYPVSIPHLLNDPVPTNPNPNLGGVDPTAPHPFSNLFGPNLMGFQHMDLPSADVNNVDWNAFDSYIQGQNMDAMQTFFPMDVGMQTDGLGGGAPVAQAQQQAQQQQQQGSANAFAGDAASNVFMGAPQNDTKYPSEGYVMGYPLPKAP